MKKKAKKKSHKKLNTKDLKKIKGGRARPVDPGDTYTGPPPTVR